MSAHSRRFRKPNYWAIAGLPALFFVFMAFGAPMILVLIESLTNPGPENYSTVFSKGLYRSSFFKTIEIATLTTVFSLLVGYPYAYVLARSGTAMRSFLGLCLLVSFWTSLLVRTFAWSVILNNTGIINTFLMDRGVIDDPLPINRNLFAVMVGMVHILCPFAVLAIYATLRSIPDDLDLAARGMGARPVVAFWRVTFPLSLPGIAAGSLLVWVLALGFYLTPRYLGGPGDRLINDWVVVQLEQYLRPGLGSAMAIVLTGLVAVILVILGRVAGIGRLLGLERGDDVG